ncbi:MAG: CBS-domain-containing membrane protein [Gammaproteobacteria bacterium]|jgi:CBS-domain-containing membrane protein
MASQSHLKCGTAGQRISFRILDPKFVVHVGAYAGQCLAAAATLFVLLCLLDTLTQTVLIAALGASAFIAFTMPHTDSSKPRYLLGGYVIGTVIGCAASLLGAELLVLSPPQLQHLLSIALAATATGCAMFLMTVTDTEHPPAAGLALGFALNEWALLTVGVVILGITGISLTKELCKSRMRNLL